MLKKFWLKKISKFKIMVGIAVGMVLSITFQLIATPTSVDAASCPDLKVIFLRGSGASRGDNDDYLTFKSALETKLSLIDIRYEFEDLDYPAIGVGVDNISVTLGAYFGSGDAYKFGESVNSGVEKLIMTINSSCNDTKFVLAGYSQGAMVASKALPFLDSQRIIYVATFGDPKIFLPEGKAALAVNLSGTSGKNGLRTGLIPAACKGENLSNYRAYVPDCYAYEGLLGSNRPYQPDGFIDKLGTWCNKFDIFCSSYYDINSHVSYVSDGLYEDASKMIFAKITNAFGLNNTYTSAHDTAFLIDATKSMDRVIDNYKREALRLAEKTLSNNGRVALYEYRDLKDRQPLVERCNFDNCTLERFKSELRNIVTEGGKDGPESLLSASFNTMQMLSWKRGSTKSMVVLTDAGFHSPDLDGTTITDVVELSKSIDPVNIYVITPTKKLGEYTEITTATGGFAVSIDDGMLNLSGLTDTIMERFDSLPVVEELGVDAEGLIILDDELPELAVTSIEDSFSDVVTIRFNNTGNRAMVILNDSVIGLANSDYVVLTGLDRSIQNTIRLVPMTESRRGMAVDIELSIVPSYNGLIPKAPDTGIVK